MPKHTIEIPCSVGDKIRVVRGYFSKASTEAVVTGVTIRDNKDEVRVSLGARTPDGDVRIVSAVQRGRKPNE